MIMPQEKDRSRSRWRCALAPLLFGALLAFACTPAESPAPEPASVLPEEGGTLYRRLGGEINTLNFVRHNTLNEKYVLEYLHDPILAWNDQHELVPALARSWEVTDGGRRFVFNLDPRATFSDGSPVRASDVVFTLQKIVDPESESAQYAGLFTGLDLSSTRALDDQTVQVVFRQPRASQIEAFNIPVLPEHVYAEGDFRDYAFEVVGSGPYVLEQRTPGSEIRLKRREDYWRQKPHIHEIVFRVIGEDATAWSAMKSGRLDAERISTDRWLSEKDSPAVRSLMEFHVFYELEYMFIAWNNRHPALSDPRVRRAMSTALDRRSIVESIYHGTARIISGPYTPDQRYYNTRVPPIAYDLEEASRLLDEAGWLRAGGGGTRQREGEALTIELYVSAGSTISQQIGQILQEALRQIGVSLRVTPLERATFFSNIVGGNFDAALLSWGIDSDPDQFTTFHSTQTPPAGQNFIYYRNREADRLIVEGRRELDPQKRLAIYHELHRVLAEDQPYTWIVQESKKWAVNRRVRNVQVARGIGLFLWHPGSRTWWIPEELQRTDTSSRE
jgi:peptide/nickel transport system substrate-binding protein